MSQLTDDLNAFRASCEYLETLGVVVGEAQANYEAEAKRNQDLARRLSHEMPKTIVLSDGFGYRVSNGTVVYQPIHIEE